MLIIYKKFQATTELGTTNYWDIEKTTIILLYSNNILIEFLPNLRSPKNSAFNITTSRQHSTRRH